jgi:hypothetical protein
MAALAICILVFDQQSVGEVLQWDLDGGLESSTGHPALVADAADPASSPGVSFVSTVVAGEERVVAEFSRGSYFRMLHGLGDAGNAVKAFSLIVDVRFFDRSPSRGWAAILQTHPDNVDNADWFVDGDGGLSIGTASGGSVSEEEWHRVALVVDLAGGDVITYLDGAEVARIGAQAPGSRFSLDADTALLFADDNAENATGLVSCIQLRDEVLAPLAIAALGGADVGGIPLDVDVPSPVDSWRFDAAHIDGALVRNLVRDLDGMIDGPFLLEDDPPAIVLEGNSTDVVVSNATANDLPAQDITVESWVFLESGTRWGGIAGYVQDNGTFERGWVLGYDDSSFNFALSATGTLDYLTATSDYVLGRWYHVVGTYDGSNLRVYIDGVLEADSRSQSGDIDYAASTLVIGSYTDDNEFYAIDGKIHEVVIYHEALSPAEVLASYDSKRRLFQEEDVAPPDDGALISRWIFDTEHVSGRNVEDVVGEHHGTIVGPVALAANPSALVLDGSTNKVDLDGSIATLPIRHLSVEAWVALDSGTRWGGILGYFHDTGAFEKGWVLGYDDSTFTMAVATGGGLTYLAADTQFEEGRWFHVVGTYDGSVLRIYINGSLENSTRSRSGDIDYEPATFLIGAYEDDDEFFPLDGRIHEARLYDTALTAGEVRSNYESKRDLFPAPAGPMVGPSVTFNAQFEAVVSWRTSAETPSIVDFGPSQALGTRVLDGAPKLTHEVVLENLERNKPYFYSVSQNFGAGEIVSPVYEFSTEYNFSVKDSAEVPSPFDPQDRDADYAAAAERILEITGIRKGYCLDYDCGQGRLALELARRSDLRIVGVSPDGSAVRAGREALKEAGVYGARVTLHERALSQLPYASNTFNLIVSDRVVERGELRGAAAEAFRVLRPSGGVAILGQPSTVGAPIAVGEIVDWFDEASVPAEVVDPPGAWARVETGALEGEGEWTHMYGDAGQTSSSKDRIVTGRDLKMQWYGRPGPRGMIDRQPRHQSPLYQDGRLFIQGDDRIFALDAYNGTVLWSLEVPGLRRVNIPRDSGNMCVDNGSLFVSVANACWRVDGQDGTVEAVFPAGADLADSDHEWGYVAALEEGLIGSRVRTGSKYTSFDGPAKWYDATSGGFGTPQVCSDSLFCIDKSTGDARWEHDEGVILNSSICAGGGRVFFVETRDPTVVNSATGRNGSSLLWCDQHLVAIDVASGEKVWDVPVSFPSAPVPVVFYLTYSEERLVAVVSTNRYELVSFSAVDGDELWSASHSWNRSHHGGHMYHPVILRDMVIVEPRAYDLFNGNVVMSGLPSRGGCSTMSAASDTVIYVDWDYHNGSFGFWDLDSDERIEFAGSRASCWLSVISGGGMVLSPTSSSGCVCRYPLQTSIGYGSWGGDR